MNYLDNAFEIINKINSKGYEAYIVGGAVRDYLLNCELNDIDMTTNMPLEEVMSEFTCLDTGLSYFGVTIISDSYSYEITEFRADGAYLDNRHPEVSKAKSLEEDSNRRDFTINALAMNSKKKIYDFHNGINDINDRVIRTIGNADVRFKEDSLRILRGLYYASKLDFYIEADTLKAMICNKKLLTNLSDTRLYSYIKKLNFAKTNKGIDYIREYNLFSEIKEYNDWLEVIDKDINEIDLPLAFYLKYRRYPKIATANDKKRCLILDELINNNLSKYVIFKYYSEIYDYFPMLKHLGYDIISLDKIRKSLTLKSNLDLAVSTKVITDLFEGKEKAIHLRKVYEAVLNGEIANSEDAIMRYVRSRYDE